MALKQIPGVSATDALAPSANEVKDVLLQGLPNDRLLDRLWVVCSLNATRGASAASHEPAAVAHILRNVQLYAGRHNLNFTYYEDYVAQQILRGYCIGQNDVFLLGDSGAGGYVFYAPIDLIPIPGPDGNLWRPPASEFNGATLKLQFTNPFSTANDVDTLAITPRIFAQMSAIPKGYKALGFGTYKSSVASWTPNVLEITNYDPTAIFMKSRTNFTTLTSATARSSRTDRGIMLQQNADVLDLGMADGMHGGYEFDPILQWQIAADQQGLPGLFEIPLPDGTTEDWCKLHDYRNDKDAVAPFNYNFDASATSAAYYAIGLQRSQGGTAAGQADG